MSSSLFCWRWLVRAGNDVAEASNFHAVGTNVMKHTPEGVFERLAVDGLGVNCLFGMRLN
jgi:hypothetical protein